MIVYRHIRLDKNEPFYIKTNRKEIIIDNIRYMSIGHAAYELDVKQQQVLSRALIKGYQCKGKNAKYADDIIYTKELINIYFEKYPDMEQPYPHPKMIEMLKSLTIQNG